MFALVVDVSSVLVVAAAPSDPSASGDCDGVGVVTAVLVVSDVESIVVSTAEDVDFVADFEFFVVLRTGCTVGVDFEAVVLTTTPGLDVGRVTESGADGGGTVCWAGGDEGFGGLGGFCIVGHKACRIPPFLIMPSSVLEFTSTLEQAWLTLTATELNDSAHCGEHPAS